jgi:hypothetical protein
MNMRISAILSLGAIITAMNPISAQAETASHHEHHTHHEHSAHGDRGGATKTKGWRLEAKTGRPLVTGDEAKLSVTLRDASGRSTTSADLARVHEENLHLLIVDDTLSDYHHLHPIETSPGNFVVNFTPRAGGRYLVFADVTDLVTATQRYLRAEIHARGPRPNPDRRIKDEAVVDGYRFVLSVPQGISVAKGGHAVVEITGPDGKPARNLEPMMGAFAHGVGFSHDLGSVLHVHPHGPEPQSKAERAGPQIGFHISPERTGFYRLYVQVRVEGRDLFAAFGVQVDP